MFDERIVENNIFSFATNELSQDAFYLLVFELD